MHDAAILQETAIALQEIRARQSLAGILHLRVAERQPDLAHLVGSEEAVDDLNVRAQEGHILQALLQRHLRSRPHAGTLDVDTDEVHLWIQSRQLHRVLPFAAAQLQHDGVVVLEIVLMPTARHLERPLFNHAERILEHILERLHLRKLL